MLCYKIVIFKGDILFDVKSKINLIKEHSDFLKSFFAVGLNAVKTLCKKIFGHKVGVTVAAAVLTLSLTATSVCCAAKCDAALAVLVNGQRIGCVKDEAAAVALENNIRSSVCGDIDGFLTVEFKETLIFAKTDDIDKMTQEILDSADMLNKVSGLYVDGMLTAFAETSAEIEASLKLLADTYLSEGAVFKGYANSVEIKDAYITEEASENLISSSEGYLEGKTGVEIVTSRIENYDEEVPYDTLVTYDESRTSQYSKVLKRGKNGLNNVTADVIYVNGNRVDANVITCTQIVIPVDAKVKKGMCEEAIESIRVNHALAAGENGSELFTFPCEITKRTYISSYWGDGRNHKGLDIVNPKGAKIYAAADGVVSFSGWYGAYGKCVIIDHPDGKTQTLYSHNSENLVKKGDTVTAGQTIAKVGETGNATGNHLHFSVLVKGKQVNPLGYLGLSKK